MGRIGTFLLILTLAPVFWATAPIESFFAKDTHQAAMAKNGSNSGSGSSNSGSGSSSSGSGSSGSSNDDDDDDDDDHGGSGSGGSGGSGSSGSGSGSGGSGSPGSAAGASAGQAALFLNDSGIHVQFADGHSERIRAGRFEMLDQSGRVVAAHIATRQDERRLKNAERSLARNGRKSGIYLVAEIDARTGDVDLVDYRGWRETLSGGRYLLSDPNGRTVTRRPVTAADAARLREILLLD
ncbi:MAG: hypothetical protein KDE03_16455 [Rhodobacteraceae bacterium]|nr:hypothetical protein [Paracoccaceae bacterium]